jgi:GNAT superfamily N-acetyltransferase
MSFAVIRLAAFPPAFEALRASAEAEGFGFLTRLAVKWRGDRYGDDRLATVRAAFDGDEIIAVGAQTCDEYDPSPDHRRIRHFYVHPGRRRVGCGRALAAALMDDAFALAPRLHLRATHEVSQAFWDAVGFRRAERPDRSHEMMRPSA